MKKLIALGVLAASTFAAANAFALDVTLQGSAAEVCNVSAGTGFSASHTGINVIAGGVVENTGSIHIYCNDEAGYDVSALSAGRAALQGAHGVPVTNGVMTHDNYDTLSGGDDTSDDAGRARAGYTITIGGNDGVNLATGATVLQTSTFTPVAGEEKPLTITVGDHTRSSLIEGAYSDTLTISVGGRG